MGSRLQDIEAGTVTIEDFAYWINERHSIFINRFEKKLPKPWTEDPILQQYKFTNVFRQLDKGTLALKEMLMRRQTDDLDLLFFNIVWYRFFNWYKHAENLGFVTDYIDLEKYIKQLSRKGGKIFTGAHMTTGVAYEDKHISYLRACREAWVRQHIFSASIRQMTTMEEAFNLLLELYMVGRFVSYEMTCDLRFTPLLENTTDKLTWANMGPGAQRGLKRLGLPYKNQQEGLESMRDLFHKFMESNSLLDWNVLTASVPFELREVEHSLCEFDKYTRVKMREGRARSKYDGTV